MNKIKCFIGLLCLSASNVGYSQSYNDSLLRFQNDYVAKHEVVKGDLKKSFRFFAPDKAYYITARFDQAPANSSWMLFETSGKLKKAYRVYGTLYFTVNDTAVQLPVYQSQDLLLSKEYKDYLFLPFTDATTGISTYGSGRYLNLATTDVKEGTVVLDFNKAYNPYCAYVSGVYNCPIPPPQNRLPIAIEAGEMNFASH